MTNARLIACLFGCSLGVASCSNPADGLPDGSGEESFDGSANGGFDGSADGLFGDVDGSMPGGDAGTSPLPSVQYPLFARYSIAGSQKYDASWVDLHKHFDLVIISGSWESWNTSTGLNRGTQVAACQAGDGSGNPRVIQYGIVDNTDTSGSFSTSQSSSPVYYDAIANNNWWLWVSGTSGTHRLSFYNANMWQTNSTEAVPSDGSGHKLEDWFATYQVATFKTAGTANAAPTMSGWFHDNIAIAGPYAPISGADGDFDRNGTTDVRDSPTVGQAWRTGMARWATQMRTSHPGATLIGNVDYGNGPNNSTGGRPFLGTSPITPFAKLLDGSLIESLFGESYSMTTWSMNTGAFAKDTWAMQLYQFHSAQAIEPTLVIVQQAKLNANGSDAYRTGVGQATRYSFAFTLVLGDGHYDPVDANSASYWLGLASNKYIVPPFFDEFAVNPDTGVAYTSWPTSAPGRKWLGTATEAAQTTARIQGVFYRTFKHANGKRRWIFINPRGNGSQTFPLPYTMKRLTGTTNPTLNNGATINAGSSVTLPEMDAAFFLEP